MFCYVWSYVVRPECLSAFRTAYGTDGDWVRLFRRDPEYVRTNFLGDRDNPTRFMTIDFWTNREAYLSFRERFHGDVIQDNVLPGSASTLSVTLCNGCLGTLTPATATALAATWGQSRRSEGEPSCR